MLAMVSVIAVGMQKARSSGESRFGSIGAEQRASQAAL
jgi:hypothetical protein